MVGNDCHFIARILWLVKVSVFHGSPMMFVLVDGDNADDTRKDNENYNDHADDTRKDEERQLQRKR